MQQLAPDLLALFDPLEIEISGIIQAEDIADMAEAMENGTNAALMLFENVWAVRFIEAVLRANGKLLAMIGFLSKLSMKFWNYLPKPNHFRLDTYQVSDLSDLNLAGNCSGG